MMDKTELQERLAIVQAKIERLTPHEDAAATYFPFGMVGAGGRNAQKLNQRKLEQQEHFLARADEFNALYAESESLQRRIADYDAKVAREQTRQTKREAALERIRNAKPGMEAVTMFGGTVTVKKVNRKSITTMSGSRYTFEELVDVVAE